MFGKRIYTAIILRTYLPLTGKPMKLSEEAEEVATFYGRMLDHDYTTRDVFNKNFMKDWTKVRQITKETN